jgi:hypothetical protein
VGWSISLLKDGKAVSVEPFNAGSIISIPAEDSASISVTYNYSGILKEVLHKEGIEWLMGKTGQETYPHLGLATVECALKGMEEPDEPDYWKPTYKNVREILLILTTWAEANPDAIWHVG